MSVSALGRPGHASNPFLAVILTGVSGSGKTVVAQAMAKRLGWPVAEADDFHPLANKVKMHAGIPLTDDDRRPWLESLRNWISAQGTDVLVTCSALKRSYRDQLRTAYARVRFVQLDGSRELLEDRIGHRKGHFMPARLLDSQLDLLEPLQPDEDGVVVFVDPPVDVVAERAIEALGLAS